MSPTASAPLLPVGFAQLPQPLYVFDGVCVLCSGTIRFLLKRDRSHSIKFAAAQGPTGQALFKALGLPADDFETFLFIERERVYLKSAAILRFLRYLPPWWQPLRLLALLPRSIADRLYLWIARNRYRWFGRTAECLVPDPAIASRFID